MVWWEKGYNKTPCVPTTDRLPRQSDGVTVLAREHGSLKWWPTRWSDVTRLLHAEWRRLEYTEAQRARQREINRRITAKRRLQKRKADNA